MAALAAVELRRHWRSLLALGVLAGLTGAAVLGALAVGRRTSTVYDRLKAATRIDDARVLSVGSSAPEIAGLPGVRASRTAPFGVGKVDGPGVVYAGVQSLPAEAGGIATPVVVTGRMVDAGAPDEALMVEEAARRFGVRVGDVIRLKMLSSAEVGQFATGFGEPDGPAVELRVAGFARTPGPVPDPSPLLVGPAFVARHPDALVAGRITYLRLEEGRRSLDELEAGLQRLSAGVGSSDLALAIPELVVPTESEPTVRTTTRVLSGGMFVFAALVGLVGTVGVALAFVRYHSRGTSDRRVEAALGLTAGERTGARTLAGLSTACVAAAVALGGSLAAAGIGPLGGLHDLEPHPGWSPNVAILTLGALAAGLLALATTAWTARGVREAAGDRLDSVRRVPLPGPIWLATGVRFALDGRAGRRRVPVRSSLAGVVLGILGVVATATFATSRDSLVSTPARWGATEDFMVADVTPPVVSRLVADERVEAVSVLLAGVVRTRGVDTSGYAALGLDKGSLGWTIRAGRMPTGADEVTVGTRLARRFGLEVGDGLLAEDAGGREHRYVVVGTGVGPSTHRERLGDNLLFTPPGLERVQRAQPDQEALVRVAPGAGVESLRDELARELEVVTPEQPSEIRNLVDLGRLPLALGACLAVIAGVALGHALVVTANRRAWDLAVLRVLGCTPGETGGALLAMALTTAVVGMVGGILFGLAAGRLAWSAMVGALGLSSGPSVPAAELAVVAAATVAGSVLIAAVPARRASNLRPAEVLRQE